MSSPKHQALTEPCSGKDLAPKKQPGYYPGFSTLAQQAYWDAKTRKVVLERLKSSANLRFFTAAEAATMEAVMDRILPQDDRTADRRIPLLPTLDDRLHRNRIDGYRYQDMPSDQDAYRIAADAFEQMARSLHQHSFHELTVLQQEEILQSIHDATPSAAEDLWRQMNIERFWTLLLSDCSSAYYAHPWAWDEIGFGGPAYPRGYMRLEEGEPEPWEVSEKRYEWKAPADTLSDTAEQLGSGAEDQTHGGQGGTH